MFAKLRALIVRDPNAIWFIAGPLAIIGFGLALARAVIEWRVNHDPHYLIVFAIFGTLGSTVVFKLWQTYRRFIP